jgi:hypothetical protein
MADEDPNILLAEDDGANGEEDIESEDDDDDVNSDGDDMDDSGEDNDDDEESGNDEDDVDDEEKMKNMEIFIRTFHNGNYDIEFDAALSLDRGVTLLVRPTQASYDKPDNWVERNRVGLEIVKEQLQTIINNASHDKNVNLQLEHDSYRDRDGEPIVWHEPILDAYWDQLEARIKEQEIVTKVGSIRIVNVEMKKERMAALVEILSSGKANCSSTHIQFYNANVCGEGIVCLSKLVDVSSNLQEFVLYHNRMDNMDSARYLSRSLKLHTCINQLWLNHCNLGSSPEILSVILQSEVKRIDLHCNNIDSLGAVKIAEYLEVNPPIEHLFLDYNRLNDDDAVLISRALKRNTNLRQIDLRSNNFTSIGVKALLTCVFDSSSLNTISKSNHTLHDMNIYTYSRDSWLQDCIDRLLELDRTEKILLALQDKDSLIQYLANVPVGLIPEVMAFPLRQVDNDCQHQCRYLNIVYSTMRWWNMPMLYSYQNCNCSGNMMSDRKRNRDD